MNQSALQKIEGFGRSRGTQLQNMYPTPLLSVSIYLKTNFKQDASPSLAILQYIEQRYIAIDLVEQALHFIQHTPQFEISV